LQAIAFKTGMTDSPIHSADYDYDNGQRPMTYPLDMAGIQSGQRPLAPDVITVTYTLDKAGNRTNVNGTSYSPNSINQYTSVGGTAVTNGLDHEIKVYGGFTYTYMRDQELSRVTATGFTYDLGYDAIGRCVKRTINGDTTYYIYDGDKPILEYRSNGQIARNLYGKRVDEILMRTDPALNGGQSFYYQQDHEGSVTHLTNLNNGSGQIIERYRYDAFGLPTIYAPDWSVRTGSSYGNRFLFTGREYDGAWVYEYRARLYHSGLGRFMSEDPKLFDAGDYNLFRYCHNDPIDLTDPMGLEVGFGESLIPVWGSGRMAYDAFNEGHHGWAAFHTAMAISDVLPAKAGLTALGKAGFKSLARTELGRTIGKTLEHKTATGYRYISTAEVKAIKDSGMRIPTVDKAGEPKAVFFTNEKFTLGTEAGEALSMKSTPKFRAEFDLRQAPAGYGGLTNAGRAEFTLKEGAKPIKVNQIVPLRDASPLDLQEASRHVPLKLDQ
jgi:RHS repeat-associated protein